MRPRTHRSLTGAAVAALFLAGCATPPATPRSTTPSAADGWPRCTSDQFEVSHPPGWFVHPRDESLNLAACELFGSEEFDTEREGDWGWAGAQIVLSVETGCRGSFERVVAEDELEIGGFPAFRRTLEPGEGDPSLRAYEYLVILSPGEPCERSTWLYGRTESDDPGHFQENSAILDRMIASLDLHVGD